VRAGGSPVTSRGSATDPGGSLRRIVSRVSCRPRRALIVLVAACAAGGVASAAGAAANPVAATIEGFGKKHRTISVLVERMGPAGPATIAAWRPSTALAPASTMKIITAASALMTVGPDFRFTTRVEAAPDTRGPGGTINGPAYLIGAGDPMLSTRAYSRANFSGLGTSIDDLARDIRENGTTRITGGVVVDETLFDRERMGPLWKSSYRYECPPLSGIATNQNRADNGANVSSPAIAAGQRLVAALRRQGVQVSGPVRAGRDAPGGDILGQVRSKPMARILDYMNATSDNFTAEVLTKGVGAYGTGSGSTPAGTRRAEQLMRERGVLTASDDFIDGSGLSHSNRVSAATLVGVLKDAQANPQWGRVLINSMPQGGEGTLIRRLKGPAVRYRVHAKTGYINGVASLAGTVTSPSGVPYAFAFLMNTSDIGGAQRTMDRAVTLLATGRADAP
jgi:serine-type D-Ala-D-Ala carboxypeptidase/endopeptidase (penicillin-binding protein 4)